MASAWVKAYVAVHELARKWGCAQKEDSFRMQRTKAAKVKTFLAKERTVSTHKAKGKAPKRNKSPKKAHNSKPAQAALTFRDRVQSDDEYIVQLTQDQLGNVHQLAFGEAFPRDQFLQYIQSGAPTVVVEQNGKRIGYYSYLIGPDGKMHISAMVIEPHYQSSGVGTQVMQRLEGEASTRNVHTLEVFVQANNEKSLAFTRKLGFLEVFRLEPNTIVFQKQLNQVNREPAATAVNPTGYPTWPYPPLG